ncbi:MAG: glycosyltransferase family 39 protein [Leptospiraceae bacterium]|nr:glycosyltransferase family 39 protein [Leptospiraceae bacterium]
MNLLNKSKILSNLPSIYGLFYFLILICVSLNEDYGLFVDELYYLASAKRLAWGYVDQPPFSIFILKLFNINGESTFYLRLFPSLLAGLTVYLVGKITQEINGKPFSVSIACISTMTVPVLQVLFSFYSMNSFEVFFVASLIFVLLKVNQNQKYWLLIGAIIGLGFLNKHTFLVYALAITIPYSILKYKNTFYSKYFYFGILISAILVFPNIYWQFQNSLASLEFYKNAIALKNVNLSYIQIILDQILSQNPITLPIWIAGIYFFLQKEELRFIAIAYIILILFFIYSKSSRPDRIAAIYPILFAGGAVYLYSNRITKVIFSLIILVGLILAPISLPILNPNITSKYVSILGIVPQIEKGKNASLPQWLGDRMDWKEFTLSVQESINSLTIDEKNQSVVLGNYYGHAGSLELYKISIPIISGHNNYFLWMNELQIKPTNLIIIGNKRLESLNKLFEESKLLGNYSRRYTNENEIPIYLLKKNLVPMEEILSSIKEYR